MDVTLEWQSPLNAIFLAIVEGTGLVRYATPVLIGTILPSQRLSQNKRVWKPVGWAKSVVPQNATAHQQAPINLRLVFRRKRASIDVSKVAQMVLMVAIVLAKLLRDSDTCRVPLAISYT